jgi:hypothetical protein
MVTIRERRQAIRTIEGWAISVLLEAGAIRECEEHGWMKDRTDPHARFRAIEIARSDPPPGFTRSCGCRGQECSELDRRHLPGVPAWRRLG